jgi:uncharacterized protein YkuJ
MDELNRFVNRLNKIGVELTLVGNYPWIYLSEVNGKTVTEVYKSERNFTIGFYPIGDSFRFTNLPKVFTIIRKYSKIIKN